jgi:predicted nucleotidyltransferase
LSASFDVRTKIRREARSKGLDFLVDYRKGKGGHAMVYVGDKLTTLPSREIDPKTARKIRKQLGLAD